MPEATGGFTDIRRSLFSSFTIKSRMIAGGALIFATWVATIAISIHGLVQARSQSRYEQGIFNLSSQVHNAYEGWLTDDDQSNMYVGLAELRDASQNQLMATTWGQVQSGYSQAQTTLTKLSDSNIQSVANLARQTLSDLSVYNQFTQQFYNQDQSGNLAGAITTMTVTNAQISNTVQSDFNRLSVVASSLSSSSGAGTVSSIHSSLYLLVLLSLVGMAFSGIAIMAPIILSISRPAREVLEVLEEVEAGRLDVRSITSSDDEFGKIAKGLNSAIDKQQQIVASLAQRATDLHRAAIDMRDNAESIYEAADENNLRQSTMDAATEELNQGAASAAAAADELKASISDIASQASHASKVAEKAVSSVSLAAQKVNKLTINSEAIGNIAQVIDRIADKTNLLALNATIEAARAGESGRGFAVVANEVKELAAQTREATSEIADMIDNVQAEIQDTVESINQIDSIVGMINESQISIAGSVEEQRAATSEIARTINEVAISTDAIKTAIEEGSNSVVQVKISSSANRQASDNLTKIADEMRTMTGAFRY